MEKNFTYLQGRIPDLLWDLPYAGKKNLTGMPLPGYRANVLIGTISLHEGLIKATKEAKKRGYLFSVFDAYRPQKAVKALVHWATLPERGETKEQFYPTIKKEDLFSLGYIATKSAHSRGSAIDLTLVDRKGKPLNMGTTFDFMSPKSHFSSQEVGNEAVENRKILREIMETSGFLPYEKEWWHFSLAKEPYPDTYFDFDILNQV
ncbi:MAG: M15 family metallopeptidase [Clostridiales bacterium]|nr:M15 family metallopeptidase [Clostridiales bacterium]